MTNQDYINKNRTITFKKGDKVVMCECLEAEKYQDKIWECMTDSFKDRGGSDVVFLKGFSGYFSTEFLKSISQKKVEQIAKNKIVISDGTVLRSGDTCTTQWEGNGEMRILDFDWNYDQPIRVIRLHDSAEFYVQPSDLISYSQIIKKTKNLNQELIDFMKWYKENVPIGTQKESNEIVEDYFTFHPKKMRSNKVSEDEKTSMLCVTQSTCPGREKEVYRKHVLKLDKNFHVYVHGSRDKLDAERDENGNYLKLYFKEIK